LGGPGTPGILIFNSKLYSNTKPDNPGGGTVSWTTPWGEHRFLSDIEAREDGGTPPFLQTIRTALSIRLKEKMGVSNILEREEEILHDVFEGLEKIEGLHILAGHVKKRIGAISFYVDELHFNLGVQLLNDRYGVQVRGGCSCAGTYGHYLLSVSQEHSCQIRSKIDGGDLTAKPGWIRLSVHPTMSDEEVALIIRSITEVSTHHKEWGKDYKYNCNTNEYSHIKNPINLKNNISNWFDL